MTFYLHKSDKPEKKYYVQFENPDSGRLKKIYFGAAGYPDFILSGGDEERKKRYLKRHSRMGENYNNPYSGAGFWAKWILWNKPSVQSSINDTKKRFNIKIINKTKSKTGGANPLNEKHSAYRSMKLAQKGLTKPTTKANKGALIRWNRERWLNLTAQLTDKKDLPCGTKGKKQKESGLPSVCRPSIRISKETPMLAKEFTTKQIKKAIQQKQKGQRINWSQL